MGGPSQGYAHIVSARTTDLNRRLRAGAWLAVACIAPAAGAGLPAVPATPPTAEFRPVQGSALVTRRDLRFVLARWTDAGETTTVLAHQRHGTAPRPVARLIHTIDGDESRIAVQPLLEPRAGAAFDALSVATLEHLYSTVFQQQPKARFCLGTARRICDPAEERMSHAQVLRALANLRASAAARLPSAARWHNIELHAQPARSGDADVVGVRASSRRGPLQSAVIYFDRAPHSICHAPTDGAGAASCRLEDQHGDGHAHDHATSVVATFPGDVRAERVLLPTTVVIPAGTGGVPAAFARPLPLPFARP